MPNKFSLPLIKGIFKIALFFDKRDATYNPQNVSNILLLNTTGMGDTLFSTPSIRAVKETFPEATIVSIVSKPAREVLFNNPFVDRFIDFPGKMGLRFFYNLTGIIKLMRKDAVDLSIVIDSNDPEAPVLSYISGAPIRIGWFESRLSFLFTHTIKKRTPGLHFIDSKLKAFETMGIKDSKKNPEIFLTPCEEENAVDYLKQSGIQGNLIIGLHPFGAKRYKNWPLTHVVSLVKMLHSKYECKIILFGGKKERAAVSGIVQEVRDSFVNLAGKTDIRQTAALIKRCSVFISTDSGPMHLSQAVGTPTIVLFGPTESSLYGPRGERYIIIKKPVECSPCKYYNCPDVQCMSSITPEDVCKAVDEMLDKR